MLQTPQTSRLFLQRKWTMDFKTQKKKKSVDIFLFPQVALTVKKPPASAGGQEMRVRSGGPPGGGNGNPHQHSCLKNPMDREAWWATVQGGHKELDMTE